MEQVASNHRSLLVLCSVLSLVAGGLIGFLTPHPRSQPVTVVTPDPTPTPLPTPTPAPLRIYVSGAVANPAVYLLPPGSLGNDALVVAGGPAPDADLDSINLARELMDQQQVYVPRLGDSDPPAPFSGGVDETSATLININTASASELESLPQVGPSTAQNIVEYRDAHGPFQSPEDVLNVPGIGPATLEQIRDLIIAE